MLPSFFRTLISFLIFVVTTAFGLICFAGSEVDYNPGTVLKFHTEGEFIYDQFGRVVLFRGANTPGNYDYPFPYGPKDIDILKKFGFNFIRIGISWKEVEKEEGKYNYEHIADFVDFIRQAQKRGIYAMPEVHQVQWCVQGGDIPDWMCESISEKGLISESIRKETNRFWYSKELQSRLIRFWVFLAEEFKNVDGVFAYNILNEPFSFDGLVQGKFEKCCLFPFYNDVIKAIRKVDPKKPIVVEPHPMTTILPAYTEPILYPNIVYAPHPYFPHAYLPGKGLTILWEETPKYVRAKYKRYKKDAERMNAPLLIGEYGAPRPSQFTFVTDWIKENLRMQDRLFIGSAVWVYHPSDGDWGIINHNREIKPYYFNILRRPYPRYTAGKPIELLYSPESKSFRYKYHGAAMCAPTEIYYPQDLFDSSKVNISASCDVEWSYDRAEEVIYIQSGCEGEVEVKIEDKPR